MKILFLEIDLEREWAVASLGPAFIGAFLRHHGHEVCVLRVPLELSSDRLIARIREQSPDILGLSLTSRQWLRARELVRAIRAELDIPVIAGGLHATFATETILQSPGFDYACLGEGELAMLELVEALEKSPRPLAGGLRNIWKSGGDRPELRPPFEPIDELPFMARDMLDERYGVVHMSTQRGCPFPCTYCAARQFNDLYGSYAAYGRRRSLQNVLEELSAIQSEGELNYVIFLDDTFTLNHAWVKTFCRNYGRYFGVPFSLHARVETVNQRMLEDLAEAGCRHITYGVESGSERVRQEIMHRHASNAQFCEGFRWTRQAGILVTANYIIGTPGETRADIEQTLSLHDDLAPDDFGYFVFYPYPGTPLFHLCEREGYLPANYYELPANHRRSILNLPGLSAQDIEDFYHRFTEVRERDHLARLVEHGDSAQQQTVITQVAQSAAQG